MMAKRHASIGIQQVLRYEWMQKAANLLLAGIAARTIRQELHAFLAEKKGSGRKGPRSDRTRTFAVDNLMNIWVSPDPGLIPFRDALLLCLQEHPASALALHWGMLSAAYPFWFNVARQTGRLLALQDQVTQKQIITRMKEQYGDRQTVSRSARHVIRSFVAWGVLRDAGTRGCYERSVPLVVNQPAQTLLLIESVLLATADGRGILSVITSNPGLFPFQLESSGINVGVRGHHRVAVARYGLDDELVTLAPLRVTDCA